MTTNPQSIRGTQVTRLLGGRFRDRDDLVPFVVDLGLDVAMDGAVKPLTIEVVDITDVTAVMNFTVPEMLLGTSNWRVQLVANEIVVQDAMLELETLTHTFADLMPNTNYTVQVRGESAMGVPPISEWLTADFMTMMSEVRGAVAPTSVGVKDVVAEDAVVFWTPPDDAKDTTGWRVQLIQSDATISDDLVLVGVNEFALVNLMQNTAYSVQVRGESTTHVPAESAWVPAMFTTGIIPGAVKPISVTIPDPGHDSAEIRWRAPQDIQGTDGWRIHVIRSMQSVANVLVSVASRSYQLDGLVPERLHIVRVRGESTTGQPAESAFEDASFMTTAIPGAVKPDSVSVEPKQDTAQIRWVPPADIGGTTHWRVFVTAGRPGNLTTILNRRVPVVMTSFNAGGMQPESIYTANVRGESDIGIPAMSDYESVDFVTLAHEAPIIDSFTLTPSTVERLEVCQIRWMTTHTTEVSITIAGLEVSDNLIGFYDYATIFAGEVEITIVATGRGGTISQTMILTITPSPGAVAPISVSVDPTTTSAIVTWERPSNFMGTTDWHVRIVTIALEVVVHAEITLGLGETTHTFDGLTGETTYFAQVRGQSRTGEPTESAYVAQQFITEAEPVSGVTIAISFNPNPVEVNMSTSFSYAVSFDMAYEGRYIHLIINGNLAVSDAPEFLEFDISPNRVEDEVWIVEVYDALDNLLATKSATLQVLAAGVGPTIDSFIVSPNPVEENTEVTIAWETTDAVSVSVTLQGVEIASDLDGDYLYTPLNVGEATIGIVATAANGITTEQEINLVVEAAAASGAVAPTGISVDVEQRSATVRWRVPNDLVDTTSWRVLIQEQGRPDREFLRPLRDRDYRVTGLSEDTAYTARVRGESTTDEPMESSYVSQSFRTGAANLPTIDTFTVSPNPVELGEEVEVEWTTTNATSVEVAVDGGVVSSSIDGSYTYTPANSGSVSITIRATGPGGTVDDEITLDVVTVGGAVRPTNVTADPSQMRVIVEWDVPNDLMGTTGWRVQVRQGTSLIGDVLVGVSVRERSFSGLSPDTPYTARVRGESTIGDPATSLYQGTPFRTDAPAPTASISASDRRITTDETSEIEWVTEHASNVSVTHNGNEISDNPNSSAIFSPLVSQTGSHVFRVTAMSSEGSAVDSVTVVVDPVEVLEPILNISLDEDPINFGDSTRLRWRTTNVTSVELLEPYTQTLGLSGSIVVDTADTYTIRATGPGGSIERSITLRVNPVRPGQPNITDGRYLESSDRVLFNWNAPSSFGGASRVTYNVYRNGEEIASGLTSTIYYDEDLPAGAGNYLYTVRAENSAGEGPSAGETIRVPGPPSSFTLNYSTSVQGGILIYRLIWTAATTNPSTRITYSVVEFFVQTLDTTTGLSYALGPNIDGNYVISAENSRGNTNSNVLAVP